VKNVHSSTHKFRSEKIAGGVRLRSDGAAAPGEVVLDWDIDEGSMDAGRLRAAGQRQRMKVGSRSRSRRHRYRPGPVTAKI